MDDYKLWIAASCPGTWLQHFVSKVLIELHLVKLLQVPFLEMAMPGHVLTMDTFIPFILLVVCVYAIWCLEKLVGYSTGVLRRSNFYQSPLFFESFFMVDAHGPCFFWLQVMNYICSLFFLVELILRMIAWLGDPDNFIDLSTKWDWRKPLLSCVFVCTLIFIFFNFACTQVLKIDKHHASHGKTPTRLWSISFWGIGLNSSRGLGVEAWKSSGVLPVAVFPVLVDLAPKTMRPKKSCICMQF